MQMDEKRRFIVDIDPCSNFIEEMKTSGRIDLIDRELFRPGEEGVVEIAFFE